MLMVVVWVETDGWKKTGPSHSDYWASRNSSPWLKPREKQLKSGGGVSNKQNITDFLCSDFYVDRPTVNVDISHCSGWSQSWHIKWYRPSVWKLCLNLNSISVSRFKNDQKPWCKAITWKYNGMVAVSWSWCLLVCIGWIINLNVKAILSSSDHLVCFIFVVLWYWVWFW